MSEGEGIVLPPLPPPERRPEGSAEAAGEGPRGVRRAARVWGEDDEPAYVGAPPSPLVSGRAPLAGERGGLGELPPPSHPWDDIPGATGPDSDPFAEPATAPALAANVRARWVAGSVVVVLLGVLGIAVQRRGGAGDAEVAPPQVTWRLPAEPAEGSLPVVGAPAAELAPLDAPPAIVAAAELAPQVQTPPVAALSPETAGSVAPAPPVAAPASDPTRAPAPALGERRRLAGVPRSAPNFPSGDGLLVVIANQHGTVRIDGVDAGPLDGFVPVELPAGHYPVEVRTAQAVRTVEVRVDSGSLRRVQVDFASVEAAPAPAPVATKARPRRKSSRKRPPAAR